MKPKGKRRFYFIRHDGGTMYTDDIEVAEHAKKIGWSQVSSRAYGKARDKISKGKR